MRKNMILSALTLSISFANAQDTTAVKQLSVPKNAPVTVEVFSGTKYTTFQNFINKRFSEKSPFGFFNIVNYNVRYTTVPVHTINVQSFLTVKIHKGLIAGVGGYMNTYTFYPIAVLGYMHGTKKYSFMLLPTVSLSSENSNQALLTFFQYRPDLAANIKLYSRLQIYSTFKSFETRTYTYEQIRLGAEIKQLQFGIGVTFEQLSHQFNFQNANVGLFVRKEFFN